MPNPRQCPLRLAATARHRAQLHAKALTRKRQYATVTELPQPGDSIHGFTVQRKKHVPELQLDALLLEHDRTGAQHLHIARDDKNNVFGISFKTNPPDHTGVPHILEHLVLCGSEKYPVRDPFFKMMPRSLQNFMNAMTSSHSTMYPFATTNVQDYKNLMSVYLDATLHPFLKANDFAQEGWRVGPAEVPSSAEEAAKGVPEKDLLFKGVVYNEMKGAMSSGDMLFYIRHRDHLWPDIQNSGGMPQQMTNLTHDQLKQFHAAHYVPSNALLFTYGKLPLAEHLQEIAPVLDRFDRQKVDQSHKLPIELTPKMETVTVKGPVDEHYPRDQQYKASLTWKMCDTTDLIETFSLQVIASLLLDGFSAPLYQNTIEVGWGASYSANTGLDTSGKIATFTVGLNGLKKNDVPRLHDGIRNTLRTVKRSGFKSDKIEGQLHQIELALKQDNAHWGLNLMSTLSSSFFNGVDPMAYVAMEERLSEFRTKMQEPRYLENLFEKYFLNENIFTFVMEPSDEFEAEQAAEEAARLQGKIAEISSRSSTPEEARKGMAEQEFKLQQVQEQAKEEDTSCLPSVNVRDIPRQADVKQLRYSTIDDTKVQWREAPTANGLTYFRGILTLKDLPDDLRVFLPLFTSAIQRLGTTRLSVEALEDIVKLKTGGISVGHHVSTSPTDLDSCQEGIAFSSAALDRNVPDMFDLIRQQIQEANFDRLDAEEKLAELIKSEASSAINDIADSGHRYASSFAAAGLTPGARLNEEVGGLTQTRLIMDLAARGSAGLSDVLDKLKAIQSFSLCAGPALRCAITCSAESTSANEAALSNFLSSLPADVTHPATQEQIPYPRDAKSFFPLPYQVYYAALALRTVPYTSVHSAPLQVLAQLLTHKHLHPEIREKGGAYGAFASARGLGGILSMSTYRDPNPLNSIKIMSGAGRWAADRDWSTRELEEAKLSVFQGLDAPKSVQSDGMVRFLTGVEPEMEQEMRERLLDVKPEQVREVAESFLVKAKERGESNTVLLGKEQEWTSEEQGWFRMPMGSGEAAGGSGGEGEGDMVVL